MSVRPAISFSPVARRAAAALLPLCAIAVIALAGLVAVVAGRWSPAYDRLAVAKAAHEHARQTWTQWQHLRQTEGELQGVWRTLPARTEFPTLILAVSDLARAHHIPIPGMNYTIRPIEEGLALRASMAFKATGDYAAIRRFIYELETTSQHVVIEGLEVHGASGTARARGGPVTFTIALAGFLKPDSKAGDGR
jgi:Tfp pilus assembly protein PilO